MIYKLGLVTGLPLLLSAAMAQAMDIRPECKQMYDKVGCTCALNNGGAIVPNNYRFKWVSVKNNVNGRFAPNEAFIQCMRRNGRG